MRATQWNADPAMQKYKAFMREHYPEGDLSDRFNAHAYVSAQLLVQVLTQCGDSLTSENILQQATSLKDYAPDLVLPGITITTSTTDYELFERVQLARIDGRRRVVR